MEFRKYPDDATRSLNNFDKNERFFSNDANMNGLKQITTSIKYLDSQDIVHIYHLTYIA